MDVAFADGGYLADFAPFAAVQQADRRTVLAAFADAKNLGGQGFDELEFVMGTIAGCAVTGRAKLEDRAFSSLISQHDQGVPLVRFRVPRRAERELREVVAGVVRKQLRQKPEALFVGLACQVCV